MERFDNPLKYLICITTIVLISCTEGPAPGASSVEDQLHLPKVLTDTYFGGYRLPDGTTTSLNEKGGVNFNFPAGVFFFGIDSKGEIVRASSSCYSCSSTCTEGCDVVKLGNDIGCNRCEPPSTETCEGKPCESDQIVGLEGGGFVNFNSGIKFINNKQADELEKLASPTIEVLMQIPEVNEKLEAFYRNVWKEEVPGEGNYDEVLVNLFGSVATFYVPKSDSNEESRLKSEEISCNCTSGSTGCTLEEIKKFGTVIGHKCTAGSCTTCQMHYPEK